MIRYLIFLVILLVCKPCTKAQAPVMDQKEMQAILDKAYGQLKSGNVGFYFEGLAFNVKKPLDIFTLPSYKVYRGGYYYTNGNKFEMNLGRMKAISNGKVMLMIDEVQHEIIIDSIRVALTDKDAEVNDALLQQALGFTWKGDPQLEYAGKEKVKGHTCHVLRTKWDNSLKMSSVYYIDQHSNKMVLMADKHADGYDVYWIKKIDKAPAKHDYSVFIPNKEVNKLYGYQVTDMRFVGNFSK